MLTQGKLFALMVLLDVGVNVVGKIIMGMIRIFPIRKIFRHGYIENRTILPPWKRRAESNFGGVLGVTVKINTSSLTAEIPVQLPN